MTAREQPKGFKPEHARPASRTGKSPRLLFANLVIAFIAAAISGFALLGGHFRTSSLNHTPTASPTASPTTTASVPTTAAIPAVSDFSVQRTGSNTLSVNATVSAIPNGDTFWFVYRLESGRYFPVIPTHSVQQGSYGTEVYLFGGKSLRVAFVYSVLASGSADVIFRNSRVAGLAFLPSDALILAVQQLVIKGS